MEPVNDTALKTRWHGGPTMPKIVAGCAGICLGIILVIGSVQPSQPAPPGGNDPVMPALVVMACVGLVFWLVNSAWSKFLVDRTGIRRRSLIREKTVLWRDIHRLEIRATPEMSEMAHVGWFFGLPGALLGLLATVSAKPFQHKVARPEDEIWEAVLIGLFGWPLMRIPRAYPYEFFCELREQAQSQGVKVLTAPR